METISLPKSFSSHVVAIPYPHRSHVNCMMNLCKSIASRRPNQVLITVIVTQEWLGYIGSEPMPYNICFASIPNVIPPEHDKAADVSAFFEAAMRNMEAPSEELLAHLEPPVNAIVGDVELGWPAAVANRRNIPVAVLWTMSARCYNITHQLGVLAGNRSMDVDLLDEQEMSMRIPEMSSAELSELRKFFHDTDLKFMQLSVECLSQVPKANYLLLNTIQELEPELIDFLKTKYPFPVFPIGPSIPFSELEESHSTINGGHGAQYMNWWVLEPLWVDFCHGSCVCWCANINFPSLVGSSAK
ncbi:hypothetical protein L6164_028768 [Bauhinia variegata]|uniref:Uncharacterized protein n=1 Tax=Bauhinia variegata TaxID=167791 RepID=A0ACB9L768_BAUVA|nr:hypothetical protein L6164_028768 [Bauhinia variegata]